jgi:hypothetical protein
MEIPMRRRSLWTFLLLYLPLAACQSSATTDPLLVDQGPICPVTAVLSDAVTVTKLKPGAGQVLPVPANVAFSAEMSQAVLECDYDPETNRLVVNIEFAVKGTRGPAATGQDPPLEFFVAVVDADNNILSKRVFQSRPLMAGRTTNTFTQTVDDFPVPLAMDTRPYDYEILTGFQLTAEELAFNRLPRSNAPPASQIR